MYGKSAAELTSLLRAHTKDSELHLGNKTFPAGAKIITARDVHKGQGSTENMKGIEIMNMKGINMENMKGVRIMDMKGIKIADMKDEMENMKDVRIMDMKGIEIADMKDIEIIGEDTEIVDMKDVEIVEEGIADAKIAKESWTLCEVGIPWTPEQFYAEAKLLEHPFQAPASLPDRLLRAIHFAIVEGPSATIRHRWAWLERWKARSLELQEAETRLHAAAHPDVQPFLEGT